MIRVQSIDNSSFRSIAAPRKRCDNDYDAKFLWESRNILQESTYFTIPRISHESVVYVRFLHVRSFTVRLKHKKKKKKIKIYRRIETLRPSTRTSQFHLSQIQHLLNPRIRVPPNTAPCCTTSAAEETKRKLEKAGLSRGFGVPIQPRGKVKEGKRKKKGGHPDRLNSVVSAAIKLFLKYSHITGRWYANIPVPGLCRPLPRSDYSL